MDALFPILYSGESDNPLVYRIHQDVNGAKILSG
jgi:hypothetical protein